MMLKKYIDWTPWIICAQSFATEFEHLRPDKNLLFLHDDWVDFKSQR